MKGFEKFLFFYSIIAITIFFVSFGVFSPSPLNFIAGALMLPLIFYFWLRLTDPQNSTPGKWSFRFITSILIVSLLGIFGFYLSSFTLPQMSELKSKVQDAESLNQKTNDELKSVSAELANLQQSTPSAGVKTTDTTDVSISDLIDPSPSAVSTQRITGIAGMTSIDVYQSPVSSSKKIGTLLTGIYYPYLSKQNGWYKIVLSSTTTGWVNGTQVVEK